MKDDLISRKEAIDAVCMEWCGVKHQDCRHPYNGEDDYYWCDGCETVLETLPDVPAAQQKRMRGRWERHNTYHCDDTSSFVDPDWRCSECGSQANVNAWFLYDLTNFCPNCGADMRNDIDIAKDILHNAIDNSTWAEDAYPNIKERLHKAVDEYEEKGE